MNSFFPLLCIIISFGLIWGSFLNAVAYRLIIGKNLYTRSACPHCNHVLAWYDLLPVISWLLLKGHCRSCSQSISWLYPFIEITTAILTCATYLFIPSTYWLGYALFFSALIITLRTDLEFMLISRFVTLYALPLYWALAYFNFLPLSCAQSFIGSFTAYLVLYAVKIVFYLITKKEGLGDGDGELLAAIGACTGIVGWWMSLLFGSLLGTISALGFMLWNQKYESLKIPFGPFLATGAIIYVFFAEPIHNFLLIP